MSIILEMRILELLTARLCHELSGPIAAVGNGVELLGEDDPDFARDALTLVADSARRAANRLQFYRFAYGFSGDRATTGPAPLDLVAKFFEGTPIRCDYAESVRALPLDQQKLGCNLLLVGADTLSRGGYLALDATLTGLQLEVVGRAASLVPEQGAALRLEMPVQALSLRTVNAYFAGLLARAGGWRLVGAEAVPGRFRLASIEGSA